MELRAQRIEVWDAAPWGPVADQLRPVHEHLVAAAEIRAGERVLDVATGTGGAALAAARLGATVTGLDFSPQMLAGARAAVAAAGLSVELVEGDAEALPFADASFDAVVSSFGMVFAPDRAAVARELARVCRSGGRLAYSVWLPDATDALYDGLEIPARLALTQAEPWRDEDEVRTLLEPAFELTFEPAEWAAEMPSAEALWAFTRSHVGPFKLLVESLDEAQRSVLESRFLASFEPRADGSVVERADYLLVTGRRSA